MKSRIRRKVARQLKGFRPREGYPEIIRKAFAGKKIPHNLEVEVDEDGKICLRMHIRVDSWKDAAKALRQMTRAKVLAEGSGIPVVTGTQRPIVRTKPGPRIIEADFAQAELRVAAMLADDPKIRAMIEGDGRPVDLSDYKDAPPSGLLMSDDPENLAKWLTPGMEGVVISRTETGRPRNWKPGPGPFDRPNPFRKK